MTSEWQRKWSRLDPDEPGRVRTRLAQAVSKRIDLALYRDRPRATGDSVCAGSLPPMLKFFFGEIKTRPHIAPRWCASILPGEAEAIIHEADNICRHEFHLLGYEQARLWSKHRLAFRSRSRKAQPADALVQDQFSGFSRSRRSQNHLGTEPPSTSGHARQGLALDRQSSLYDELANQWYSWQKANPYPLGINWASTLEAAFRSLSWLWIRNLLAGCPDLPATFQTDLLLALQSHGRYIERYLSTYFSPNTHLLGEALRFSSLAPYVLRFLQQNAGEIRLENSAGRIAQRKSVPTGFTSSKRSTTTCTRSTFFLHCAAPCERERLAIPEQFDNVLKKMLDVVQALSEVGPPEGFGDDDGGRVFNPRRNQVEHMTDPLALGVNSLRLRIIPSRRSYRRSYLAVRRQGHPGIGKAASSNGGAGSKAFAAGGIYLINDHEPYPSS